MAADGRTYRYFRQDVAGLALQSLGDCYLVPSSASPPQPELACFDVVPISSYGAIPGLQTAKSIVVAAVASGKVAFGSLTLPYPTSAQGARQVLIGMTSARRLCDPAYALPYAILGDPQASTPVVPAYGQGQSPNIPPPPPYGQGGQGPVLPPVVPPPQDTSWDANIPDSVKSRVEGMLNDSTLDPAALDAAAAQLDPTYPKAAAKLRARAAELRQNLALDDAKRGGTPWQIRSGDTGSFLAQYFTGSANRWREIPACNPGMRTVTQNGVTQLVPWTGTILLPLSWNVRAKAPPGLQSGSLKPPTKTPTKEDAAAVVNAVYKTAQEAASSASSDDDGGGWAVLV